MMSKPIIIPKEWESYRLLCLKEVARILHVCVRTVQRRCHDGFLKYVKVRRAIRVEVSALLEYIEQNSVSAGVH